MDNPEDLDDEAGLESLAVEVNSGDFTMRTLWRWACYQAAEQIGDRAAPGNRGPSAGMYEARSTASMSLPGCEVYQAYDKTLSLRMSPRLAKGLGARITPLVASDKGRESSNPSHSCIMHMVRLVAPCSPMLLKGLASRVHSDSPGGAVRGHVRSRGTHPAGVPRLGGHHVGVPALLAGRGRGRPLA